MRVSTYDNIIYLPSERKYFVLHGIYGTLDLVSKYVGDLLQAYHGKEIPSETLDAIERDTVCALINRHHITKETRDEELAFFNKVAKKYDVKNIKNQTAFNFGIIVSYNCNMNCSYCYEKEILHNNKNKFHTISDEQITNIFSIIDNTIASEKGKVIQLFGGEPLSNQTVHAVDRIVKECLKRKITLTAISNGYELQYFSRLLGPQMISDIMITIDGLPSTHNSRRPSSDGSETFDSIVNNIDLALSHNVNICLRVNVDETNINELYQLVVFAENRGWFSNINFLMRYALVGDMNDQSNSNMLSAKEVYQHLLDYNNKSKYIRTLAFTQDGCTLDEILSEKVNVFSSTRTCGAVLKSILFSPDGYLYNCSLAVGHSQFAIGTFDSELHIDIENQTLWTNRCHPNILGCNTCSLALVCGGGCALKAFLSNHPNSSSCCGFKEAFEAKIVAERELSVIESNSKEV
jgi:uncharacterized protein